MFGGLFCAALDVGKVTQKTKRRKQAKREKPTFKKPGSNTPKPTARKARRAQNHAAGRDVPIAPDVPRPKRCAGQYGPLRYASDCSGIESAVVALEILGCAPSEHLWASDSYAPCRAILGHNFEIAQVLRDVFETPTPMVQPDFYTSGFPCQPYSAQGHRRGATDCRSTPVWAVVDRIARSLPKSFILENVATLLSPKFNEIYEVLVGALCNIREKDRRAYDLHVRVLDSQYHGSPQHRPRVFFVGVLRSCKTSNFAWPADLLETPELSTILDNPKEDEASWPTNKTELDGIQRAYCAIMETGADPEAGPWVANVGNGAKFGNQVRSDLLPCLTHARGKTNGFWLFHRSRMMNIDELSRCQGFPTGRLQLPPNVHGRSNNVSARQLGGMYGNAMNVCTMARIIVRLLPAIGIACHLRDPWCDASIPADCL